jgi:hypothetical protein
VKSASSLLNEAALHYYFYYDMRWNVWAVIGFWFWKKLQRADGLTNKENDTVQLLLIEDTFGIGMDHYSFSSLTHSWRCRPGNDFTWKDLCPKSLIWVHHYILEIYWIRYKKLYYVMSGNDFMPV